MMRSVGGERKVLTVTREWPWGLAVLTDPASNSEVPTKLDKNGIAASRDILAARIQHDVDGEAVAEVWLGPLPPGLLCVYDDDFYTASGAVILGDAAFERHAPAEIGEGSHRLRVLVSEVGSPERVVFEFTRRTTPHN